MTITLTNTGLTKIRKFITFLRIKQTDRLMTEVDTADDTMIPTVDDIISDISYFIDEDGDYFNGWNSTDNDDPEFISLSVNEDFTIKE